MAIVIRSTLAPFVRDVTPLGRCIRIQVSVGGRAPGGALHVPFRNSFCAVCTHGSHAALQDTFAELSSLLNGRMRLANTVVAGDFNVDMLPDFVCPTRMLPLWTAPTTRRIAVSSSIISRDLA